MKKTLAFALAALMMAAFASYSFAYEFELKGEYEWRFRWFERLGNQDLFGNAAAQDSTAVDGTTGTNTHVGLAGPNIYTQANLDSSITLASASAVGPGSIASYPLPSSNGLVNLTSIAANVPWRQTVPLTAVGTYGLAAPVVAALTNNFEATASYWPYVLQTYITKGGFSRTDNNALVNDSRLTLTPTFRINQAIRVHGVYNMGGYRNRYAQHTAGVGVPPFERYSQQRVGWNGDDTTTIGSWTQMRLTANLPWGTISVGDKDFPLGVHATLGYKARADAFVLVVPFGPMRILGSYWMARGRGNEGWSSIPDGGQKNGTFWSFVITYDDGPLSLGIANIHRMYHGTNAAYLNNLRDDNTQIYMAYMKYFNGRFFANVEYAWANVDRYRPVSPGGATGLGSGAANIYVEANHFWSEVGTIVGPMKMSLMYALASGYVHNNQNRLRNLTGGGMPGALFGTGAAYGAGLGGQAVNPFARGLNPKIYAPMPINGEAMEPYEYLMFTTYAGGNNAPWNPLDVGFVQNEGGQMSDAYCFAGRVDYAVASNLNIWASYIWAHRLERSGTYFGQFMSTGQFAIPVASVTAAALDNFYTNAGRLGGSPYVENGFIGWEANGGVDWKLLEGLTFKGRYSYWAPGDYFKEAYQAVVLTAGGGVNLFGVQNSRDPIQAFQGSLIVEF
jgi:hypothetical protein